MDPRLSTGGGTACPVCQASVIVGADLGDYRLYRCDACRCWSSDALSRGATTSFEPAAYFEHADADRDKWDALVRRLTVRGAVPRTVLDVGCGNGAFLDFVRTRFPDCRRTGIEVDAGRVAEARARDPEASVHGGDALTVLRGLQGPFDLVTLWDVFEHVAQPREVLVELGRLIAPEGLVYVQTIHEESLLPWIGRTVHSLTRGRVTHPVRRTHDAHHLVFFTLDGLRTLAAAARLRIGEHWFDRLARRRMDGSPLVTTLAAAALTLENALGNGLFVNLLLEAERP